MSKDAGKPPLWTRRWVWLALAAAAIYLLGASVGSSGSDESCTAAVISTVVEVVDRG